MVDLNGVLLDDTARGEECLLRTPMGRFGDPGEWLGAAVFLASIAAQLPILFVDGGYGAGGVNH